MPLRSLLLSVIVLSGSSMIAAAQTSSFPTPRPAVQAPRYVGPMGTNPNPSAFAAPQPTKNAFPAPVQTAKLIAPQSRNSICYTIHSYTITPESDTVGTTHPTSESTCIAATTSAMKQATQPSSGPDSR